MVIIREERQLKKTVKLVSSGDIRLLLITGSGGTGKTTTVSEILPTAMYVKGHLTPLKLYLDIHYVKPSYIVIDDVDELFKNKVMTSLLKQLCDSGIEKTLSYASTHSKLNGIPQSYDVSFIQGIVIITNDDLSKTNVTTLKALKTRGLTIEYEPMLKEVKALASTFCTKQTLKYFDDFLLTTNSLRDYKLIDNLLKAGIDTFTQLGDFLSMLSPKQQLISQLLFSHSRKEAVKLSGLSNHDFNTVLSIINAKKKEYNDKVRKGVL